MSHSEEVPRPRVTIRFTDVEAEELARAAENSANDAWYRTTLETRPRRRALERAIQKVQDHVEATRLRGSMSKVGRSSRA